MNSHSKSQPNIKQAVPFFMVKDMEASVNFYVKGLGFSMTESWMDNGKLKWCWLVIDNAALMLQEYDEKNNMSQEEPGVGVEIFLICEDAIKVLQTKYLLLSLLLVTRCGLCRLKILTAINYHLKVLRMCRKKQNILSGKNETLITANYLNEPKNTSGSCFYVFFL